jgi:chromosomal replication initiation ATPase DnaA
MNKKLQNLLMDIKLPIDEFQDAVQEVIKCDEAIETAMQKEYNRIYVPNFLAGWINQSIKAKIKTVISQYNEEKKQKKASVACG